MSSRESPDETLAGGWSALARDLLEYPCVSVWIGERGIFEGNDLGALDYDQAAVSLR